MSLGDKINKIIANKTGKKVFNAKGGTKNVTTGTWEQVDKLTQKRKISPTGGEVTDEMVWGENRNNVQGTHLNYEDYVKAADVYRTQERKREETSETINKETYYPNTWEKLTTLNPEAAEKYGTFEEYAAKVDKTWVKKYGPKDGKDKNGRPLWSAAGDNTTQYPLKWREKRRQQLKDPNFLGGKKLNLKTSSSTTTGMTGYGEAYNVSN